MDEIEKRNSRIRIGTHLLLALAEGDVIVQLRAVRGELCELSEKEYDQYVRILGTWTLEAEKMLNIHV